MVLVLLETLLAIIVSQWQLKQNVDKMNTNMLIEKIVNVLDHEQKVKSKGTQTLFQRSSDESVEVGRMYRIKNTLESKEDKGRRPIQDLCINLTSDLRGRGCSSSDCNPGDKYRSISGCCNNLESPTQGKKLKNKINGREPGREFVILLCSQDYMT